jgi:cytochrome b6-f complex iron-sulfur subunit
MPSSADANAGEARTELTRRAVLKLGLAVSGVLAAGGLVEYLQYQAGTAAPTAFELDLPSDYPAGSATHVSVAGAWLLRDAGGLYAISTRCPHLGCTVERQATGFQCPCHGSQFTLDGQLRRGPATRPLACLKLTLSEQGHVVIHSDQVTDASVRLPV